MLDDIKKDAVTRMTKCVQNFAADTRKLRTGRAHRAGRTSEGRLLRHGRAAAARWRTSRSTTAHAHHHAVGKDHGAGGRKGDPQVGPGPHAR